MTTSFDVTVIGGGTAGLAAALGAARAGARTLLVERLGLLGGMATAGMVGTVCGLYHTRLDGPPELLNDGVAGEVARGLTHYGGESPVRHGRTLVLPYPPAAFAVLADRLVTRQNELSVGLNTLCVAVHRAGPTIDGLSIATVDGRTDIRTRSLIDTSGDAVAALLAGVATETPHPTERQLPSLVFAWQHVEQAAFDKPAVLGALRDLERAERDGTLPAGASHLSFRRSARPGEVIAKLTIDHVPGAARADDLTAAAIEGRHRIAALGDWMPEHVPAFRHAFVSHVAPQLGVRERRRVIGRSQLTRDDVLGARTRPDSVARAAWPIELWQPGRTGARYEYLPDGATYDIPRGCLEVEGCDNFFVAGRCMSATHEAMGSARVIGTCLAVGEAAGRLAAARSAR
jgi:FAD dependent oxidoreductase